MQYKTGHISVKPSHGIRRHSITPPKLISYCVLGIGVDNRIQRYRGEQKINPPHNELTVWRGKGKKSSIIGNLISYQNQNVKSDAAK